MTNTYQIIQSHNSKLLLLPTQADYSSRKWRFNHFDLDLYTVERLLKVDLKDELTYMNINTSLRLESFDRTRSSSMSSEESFFVRDMPILNNLAPVTFDESESTSLTPQLQSQPAVVSSPVQYGAHHMNVVVHSDPVDQHHHQLNTPQAQMPKRVIKSHKTGRTNRQRVGPSCDSCQSKKIKCDAFIEVVETGIRNDDISALGLQHDNHTISNMKKINQYLTPEEVKNGYKLIYSNSKIIKFRNCSACETKGIEASFKRGYTKDDILEYNTAHKIMKKPSGRMKKTRN